MPSKNKNIIRRRKTRKQHRSRKHKRNNNNARNQTIRGGWRWPWRKPTPTLMDRIIERNKDFGPVKEKTPERTDLMSPSSQPRLPTNVDSVKNALREETYREVARVNREAINELKKLIEPQTKKMKALTDEYEMLGKRRDKTENRTERHQMSVRRQEIHDEIARIKREKIGSTRVDRTRVEDIERDIRTRERADARYSKNLPELPSDDILDADAEMAKVDDAAGVFGLVLAKKAVNAELELDAAERNQADLIEAMGEMSLHPGSPRSDSSARGSPRSGSTPRSGSLARGSLARDAPLPPSHGLPSGRKARDSSARDSRRSPSSP